MSDELERVIADELTARLLDRLACQRCAATCVDDPAGLAEMWCCMCGWKPGDDTSPKPPAELRGILAGRVIQYRSNT